MSRNGPIGLSDEQAALLESAAKYCGDKSPIETVRRLIEDDLGYDPAVFAEMAELGWLGIAIPESYGGAGLDRWRHLAAGLPERLLGNDRRWHEPNPGQHRGRARARPSQELRRMEI